MDQQNTMGSSMSPMGSSNGSRGDNQTVNPRKMFVGNLSWNLTSDDLRQLFAEFGTVEDAVVLTDKFSGRSKGFGFVTMSTEEEAQAAIEGLNEKEVDGRNIVVNVAQPPKPRDDRRPGGGGGFNRRPGGNGGSFGGRSGGSDRGGYSRGPRRDY